MLTKEKLKEIEDFITNHSDNEEALTFQLDELRQLYSDNILDCSDNNLTDQVVVLMAECLDCLNNLDD